MRSYLSLALMFVSLPALGQPSEVELRRGERQSLLLPEITRLAVGDPQILEVKLSGDSLELLAGMPGETTLMIWRRGDARRAVLVKVRGDADPSKPTRAVAPQAVAGPPNETVTLAAGEVRVLNFKSFRRLAVGDPAVAGIDPVENGEVVVTGASPGETTLLVWREGRPVYTVLLKVR